MTWNILDPVLAATPAPRFYPVLRAMSEVLKPGQAKLGTNL